MNGLVFRAAVRQAANEKGRAVKWSFRERRQVHEVLDNPELAELLAMEFTPAVEAENPQLVGDGTPILDWWSSAFKWVIAHQDEIIAFVKKIVEVVLSILAIFLVI